MGFFLRWPNALDVTNPLVAPRRLDGTMRHFRRYGHELEVLEHDLTECISEFRMACDQYYADVTRLELKKFAIVYHLDNFYVRVHKLIENVYGLLAHVAGLDPDVRRGKGEAPLRSQVRSGLVKRKFGAIAERLRRFEENRWIREAVGARNVFVHRYRDEPEWPMLHASHRFREPEDAMARSVRRIDQATDLDRYAARRISDLSLTLRVIRQFREEIFSAVQDLFLRVAGDNTGTRQV
jgi:hypothetical protein